MVEATDIGQGPVVIEETANTERSNYRKTSIIYNPAKPETEAMAELISAAVPGAQIRTGKTESNVDVAVVVGRQAFETKRIVQLTPIQIPKPTEPPPVCR